MVKPIFEGSCVAVVTPFTNKGVDFAKLEELLEFQIKEGTDAIVICGTTGEASTMNDEEHKSVIKFSVEKVNKRVPLIAGTGSNDTHHAIELSKYAQSVGSDAVLLVTPYYNKTTQSGLYEHFKLVAASIDIPIILYNVPSRTNLNIDVDTIVALSKIDNIVAIKECNLNQVGEIIYKCGNDFTVYSGEDGHAYTILALGGKGVISVMANIIPKETHMLVKNYLDGNISESRNIQLKYLDLIKALFIEVSPIPVKAALNLMNFNVGQCRLPLVDLAEANHNKLKATLKDYQLI